MSVDTRYGQDTRTRRIAGIRESGAFSPKSLLYAMCASVACTLVASEVGGGPRGVLITAMLGPIISMVFTTHGPPRIRTIGVVLVTIVAATVAVTGLGVSEVLRGGKSPIGDKPGTFVKPQESGGEGSSSGASGSGGGTGTGTGGLLIEVEEEPDCPPTAIGVPAECSPPLTVQVRGTSTLQITGVDGNADFSAEPACLGEDLAPGDECTIQVTFHPAQGTEADRQADLVVHHSLRGDPTTVTVTGEATDTTGPGTESPAPTVAPTTPGPVGTQPV